jgi:RHS repeat-associated protein
VVDSSGNSQKSYTYDVYGEATPSGGLANEFDFAGQQTDGTGLQYLRARYYDPETGVFISREPLAVGPYCTLHPFGYTQSRPTGFVDPTGLVLVDGDPNGGGRSDCGSLWATIVASVEYVWSRAQTWYENDYGK